jgi:hypothetical protein
VPFILEGDIIFLGCFIIPSILKFCDATRTLVLRTFIFGFICDKGTSRTNFVPLKAHLADVVQAVKNIIY